jgi:hypothetical protein
MKSGALVTSLAGATLALLTTSTFASDCYSIKDPDARNACLARTR